MRDRAAPVAARDARKVFDRYYASVLAQVARRVDSADGFCTITASVLCRLAQEMSSRPPRVDWDARARELTEAAVRGWPSDVGSSSA